MLDLKNKIEALIFLSKEPLSIDELTKYFKLEKQQIEEAVDELKEDKKNTGINLKTDKEILSFVTNPSCGEEIKNFFHPEMKIKKLSKSTMETLAIIAYKGPITKGEIEVIRGVSAEKAISNLLEKNLIYISGKKKSIGTPNIYNVTEDFYSYLNIDKEENLPGYEEFRKINLLTQKSAVSEDEPEVPEVITNSNQNNILKENEENNEIK
ncbi:Segregation and condensation protein B homolog [Sebaldella termitidis]|uniref:Chromosome segregation and condensation protein, ScpB n=1 Tax=Sebaldella termitidis (strain ATCC 33386 / NCTC 11300) TaxID=526218 RepID=D1AH00_SEBTE|nr:SMC-Scp complex subunit ScpB [Sebaldella termitidis]ACZ08034.1 chromosome segregation and condensation protein, ScpB [Sebaldella termitidis ATCC 33386]SUI23335.1 Segregation and condensation protein B homolog [Sebaldella termitidis]